MVSGLTVLWAGPVNFSQVGAARVPGAAEVNLTCTGDGSPTCGQIADSFLSEGRRLPGILAAAGADPDSPVVVGAFSAGGSVAKRIGLSAADRAQVVAMMLADATYTTTGATGAEEGYVLYAMDAATDSSKLFVSTASSSPNKSHPSGIETQRILRAEVERRLGQDFRQTDPNALGVDPAPAAAWKLGNALFLEYPDVPHGQQVTVLAERVWAATLLPWLDGSALTGASPRLLGALALGVGAGYLLWRGARG